MALWPPNSAQNGKRRSQATAEREEAAAATGRKLFVRHEGRVCYGDPFERDQEGTRRELDGDERRLGFLPEKCEDSKSPVEYGFAIGIGSTFRLQADVTPGRVRVGEPIRLTGVPTEVGLPVVGCTVTVDAVAPNGQTWTALVLRDDGAHDDGDPDDGEYAFTFQHTAIAGSYTFTFRATGHTRDGEPVNREAIRSKYVEGHVTDPPDTGGGDECCERLVEQLERNQKRLEKLLRARDDG